MVYGITDLRKQGTTDLRNHGVMELRKNGATKTRNYGSRELRSYGTTELRSYENTELRIYGTTELWNYGVTEPRNDGNMELWRNQNFFLFLPAVGLNHVVVVTRGMAMAVKLALTDRAMALDTDAMKEHQAHRRYFFCFCFYFSAMISALRLEGLARRPKGKSTAQMLLSKYNITDYTKRR